MKKPSENALLLFVSTFLFLLVACHDHSKTLPSSTGKTGELLVIMDDDLWSSGVGDTLFRIFSGEQVGLPQREPLFTIAHVPKKSFSGILTIHRNILLVELRHNSNPTIPFSVSFRKDVWAKPQLIIKITASSPQVLKEAIAQSSTKVIEYFSTEEKKRILSGYSKNKGEKECLEVRKKFGVDITIPKEYYIAKEDTGFIWLRKESGELSQGILIYTNVYKTAVVFDKENILSRRDSVTQKHIPGTVDNSYMICEHGYPAAVREISVNGVYAIEIRSLWKAYNDFMGGPFISYTLYDKINNRIITMDGYVYAPNKNKREYIRQLDAIFSSVRILKLTNPHP